MPGTRTIILGLVLVAIVGSIAYFESLKPARIPSGGGEVVVVQDVQIPEASCTSTECTSAAAKSGSGEVIKKLAAVKASEAAMKEKAAKYERAKEIVDPTGFINTPPIKVSDLIGKKVILVDFWTYSCINCVRTFPYLNAWYEKYKSKGFEILGIHTPEFDFEKILSNVQAAVAKFGIKYPVILDSNYGTWRNYNNQYWPHEFLIDIDGFIVHDHIGEGAYDETEAQIQALLKERMERVGEAGSVAGGMANPASVIGIEFGKVGSPETYFGAARNEFLGNGPVNSAGPYSFTVSTSISPNKLYLGGDWNMDKEFAESKSAGAEIVYKYNAKNVYLVASSDAGVKIKILRDGKPLGAEAGADVVREGSDTVVNVKESRLYKLIEGADYGTHTIEIIIETPGLKAFAFTFG